VVIKKNEKVIARNSTFDGKVAQVDAAFLDLLTQTVVERAKYLNTAKIDTDRLEVGKAAEESLDYFLLKKHGVSRVIYADNNILDSSEIRSVGVVFNRI
jgi:hypothetical protein